MPSGLGSCAGDDLACLGRPLGTSSSNPAPQAGHHDPTAMRAGRTGRDLDRHVLPRGRTGPPDQRRTVPGRPVTHRRIASLSGSADRPGSVEVRSHAAWPSSIALSTTSGASMASTRYSARWRTDGVASAAATSCPRYGTVPAAGRWDVRRLDWHAWAHADACSGLTDQRLGGWAAEAQCAASAPARLAGGAPRRGDVHTGDPWPLRDGPVVTWMTPEEPLPCSPSDA